MKNKSLLLVISMMTLLSCMSVRPIPEFVQGDFIISELDKHKNLVKCGSEHAIINAIENRTGSKMYFKYTSESLKINIPEAKWVGGQAYEGVNTMNGEKYTITLMDQKKQYMLAIEVNPEKFLLVGFKCWREQNIALN